MSSATPKEPSNPESPPSTTTNRSTQQSVAGGNPKFPIFLNIPPPLKPVTGTDDKSGVTTVDANFTAINAPNTVAAGAAKAPIKLNHQLFVTDCSNGCMPAYILSSLVGVLVVGALVSIFVTLKRRKTGRDYDQEATAINSTSSETDEPRFIAEKTNKHFTYRSSSLADIGSPNGLRRRSELGSPFAAMSELNKPFVFNKHPPHHSQNNQVLAPQRPSPAPPLVIPRSSEELYAAYTSGLVADEDTLPALGAAAVTANGDANKPPQLISPQPRSLKSIKLGEGVEEEPALLVKKDSPVTPLDFTTLLIPDPSATPTANEFEHSTLMAKKT